MTQTTTTRQIGILIEGILKSYGIDNLKLEVDLVNGVQRLLSSDTPARTREDILASVRKSLELSVLKEDLRINMEARVQLAMGIDVAGRRRYEDMIAFLIRRDESGQSVEAFALWCKHNPYSAPKPFQIAEKPDLLMVNWPAAFAENGEASQEIYPTLS